MSNQKFNTIKIDFSSTPLKNLFKDSPILQVERKKIWLAVIHLFGCLLITFILSLSAKKAVDKTAFEEFDVISNELKNKISSRLHAHELLLRGQAALFDISDNLTRETWKQIYNHQMIEKTLPGIQGIAYQTIIYPAQLTKHERKIRSEGFPNYKVRPERKREFYTSIIFIEPFSGRNLNAFGYDTFTDPIRRKAMEEARDSNKAALTSRVTLVQEIDKNVQAGTIMYVPVYKKGFKTETVKDRRLAIQGWVSNPYRMDDLMKGIIDGFEIRKEKNIGLQIYDDPSYQKKSLLYDNQSLIPEKNRPASLYSIYKSIPFNNHVWYLRFIKLDSNISTPDYERVWYTVLGGSIISLLLFILFISVISTNVRAYKYADELTKELNESETKYKTIFKNEVYAISIFDLETLRFLDVNDAHCSLYGYTKEELLSGMTLLELSAEEEKTDASIKDITANSSSFIPLRYHKKKDGMVFPVEIVGGRYTWQGKNVMFLLVHDITERKRAEESLIKSENKFRSYVDNSPEGIFVVNQLGKYVDANSAALKLLGYSKEELLQKSVLDLTAPEDVIKAENQFNRLLKRGNTLDEMTLLHKDGRKIYIILNTVKISESTFLGFATDISERKITEQRLLESEQRWQFALEGAGDGVWDWDLESNSVFFSKQWKNMLGYNEDEISSQLEEWSKRVHPEDEKFCIEDLNKHFSGETSFYQNEHRMLCKNGKYKWVLDRGKVINWSIDKKPLRMIGTHTDISERKRTEELLIFQTEELGNANDALTREIEKRKEYELMLHKSLEKEKDFSALKSRIISTTSHEFRTPLANVNASADILQMFSKNWTQKKVDEQIDKIKKSVKHLVNLLDDILIVSKTENKDLAFKPLWIDLSKLVKESMDEVKFLMSRSHKLKCNFNSAEKTFYLDPILIKFIIINILSNAIKYSPEGGLITINIESNSPNLTIEVNDEGIGIEENELEKVFEPFYRSQNVEIIQGSGLGLGIVKYGVELHKGTIVLKSRINLGTKVTIRIPLVHNPETGVGE